MCPPSGYPSGPPLSPGLLAVVLSFGLVAVAAPGAEVTSHWLGGSGNWTDAAMWDTPFYPDNGNGGVATYDAIIDANTLTPYTVTPHDIIIESLVLDSPSATLSHPSTALTVTDAADILRGTYLLSGGTITGGDWRILSAASMLWTSGTMKGFGTTEIAPGAKLTMSGTSSMYLGRTILNRGTVVYTGSSFRFGTGSGDNGVIQNVHGGSFNVIGDGDFLYYLPGSHAIRNEGTFSRSGAGTTSVGTGIAFDNSGLVRVSEGVLALYGGGTWSGAWVEVSEGATLDLASETFTIADANCAGAGMIQFSGATCTIEGSYTVTGATRVSGGTVTINGSYALGGPLTIGSGTLTINGNGGTSKLDLAAATLAGSGNLEVRGGDSTWTSGTMAGAGTTEIAAGARMTISGSSDKCLGRTLLNQGTVEYTGSRLLFGPSSGASGVIHNAVGGVLSVIGNGGLLVSQSGSHAIRNDGLFIQSGAGTTSVYEGIAFDNTGTVRVTDGALWLYGGGTWTRGTIEVSDGTTLRFERGTFTLTDTGSSGPGAVEFGRATAAITNWTAEGPVQFSYGSTVTFDGTYAVAGATRIARGTVTMNADGSTEQLHLEDGGTLHGGGHLEVRSGDSTWTSGTMAGAGTTETAAGAKLTISGPWGKYLGRTVLNRGTVECTDRLFFGTPRGGTGVLHNASGAVFIATGPCDLSAWTTGSHAIRNEGTFIHSGTGTVVRGIAFHNSGTVRVMEGLLSLFGGGIWTGGMVEVSEGAVLDLAGGTLSLTDFSSVGLGTVEIKAGSTTIEGSYAVAGTTRISGRVTMNADGWTSRLAMVGTLDGSGHLEVRGGDSTWRLGTMTGAGTTEICAGAKLTVGCTEWYRGRVLGRLLLNRGTVQFAPGVLDFGSGGGGTGVIHNAPGGVLDVVGDGGFLVQSGGAHAILNEGTFTRSGPEATSVCEGIAFHNTGTVRVTEGCLWLGGGGKAEGGTFDAAGGAAIEFGSGYELARAHFSGLGVSRFLSDLQLAPAAVLTADGNATLQFLNDFDNRSTRKGEFDLSAGTVEFAGSGTANWPQDLEVPGADRGLDPNGWTDNFAFGTLRIRGGTRLRLADAFDNQLDGGTGHEAQYVGSFIIEVAGAIDLNNLRLYYLNGGTPKQLFLADTDLDGDVDFFDYLTVKARFGTSPQAAWSDGDTDGDGDVDFYDYLTAKANFGSGMGGRGEPLLPAPTGGIPEPTALALLAAGTVAVLLRRRKQHG